MLYIILLYIMLYMLNIRKYNKILGDRLSWQDSHQNPWVRKTPLWRTNVTNMGSEQISQFLIPLKPTEIAIISMYMQLYGYFSMYIRIIIHIFITIYYFLSYPIIIYLGIILYIPWYNTLSCCYYILFMAILYV